MFQFRRFPAYAYLIQRTLLEVCSSGFPHSEIPGSMLICSSPRLIAACHVLLRLLMPRHSPCALSSLTFVGAKSAKLRFRRYLTISSKTPPAPLLLLSKSQPLRWVVILFFNNSQPESVVLRLDYLAEFSVSNYADS